MLGNARHLEGAATHVGRPEGEQRSTALSHLQFEFLDAKLRLEAAIEQLKSSAADPAATQRTLELIEAEVSSVMDQVVAVSWQIAEAEAQTLADLQLKAAVVIEQAEAFENDLSGVAATSLAYSVIAFASRPLGDIHGDN